MTEYRATAYFHGNVYAPRSYKRKTVYTLEDAEKLYDDAVKYYSRQSYAKYFDKVVIETREVTEWKSI